MAVSIIVCNMSVVIPAILRLLGVDDSFIQEIAFDLSLSTVEIAHVVSLSIELGIPETHEAAISGGPPAG